MNAQSYLRIIGIDISKSTFDVCVTDGTNNWHQHFTNTRKGCINMKKWLKQLPGFQEQKTLFCMEHTGLYTRLLVSYLLSRGDKVWLESALRIKRSMGITRGKTDKQDAAMIAKYAFLYQHQAKLVTVSSKTLHLLQDLMQCRHRLMKSLQSHETTLKELSDFDPISAREIKKVTQKVIKELTLAVEKTEKRMLELVDADPQVRVLYELISSVKSVGKILTLELIVYSHGFSRLLDARKLACYAGVAPFEYQSGTSIYKGAHTSSFANKQLKHHLHMSAMNAVRYHHELRRYYERKVEEGKSKMCALNAVRNKLIHRIVAVVKRGTPYQEKLQII